MTLRGLFLPLLLLAVSGGTRADVAWQPGFEAARRLAQRTGRPLLVEFHAAWCGPCRRMEATTFRDAAVQKLMGRCVCARVDIDREPAIARRFGVNAIPRLVILDARGRRLLDVLGARDARTLQEELAAALRGKPVIQTGASEKPSESPEVALLRAQVEGGRYAAWKARSPAFAAKARARLVEQLGAFDTEERRAAAALLFKLGDDGMDALVAALSHRDLAVRVAACDTLSRLLASKYSLLPAALPRYDAWASAAERARMARAWSQWWTQRRRAGMPGAL
jgi:thiol-disulfide isomerase/thioredoxin